MFNLPYCFHVFFRSKYSFKVKDSLNSVPVFPKLPGKNLRVSCQKSRLHYFSFLFSFFRRRQARGDNFPAEKFPIRSKPVKFRDGMLARPEGFLLLSVQEPFWLKYWPMMNNQIFINNCILARHFWWYYALFKTGGEITQVFNLQGIYILKKSNGYCDDRTTRSCQRSQEKMHSITFLSHLTSVDQFSLIH